MCERQTDGRRGREGAQDAMGCALSGLNEGKAALTRPPLIFEIKKTGKIIKTPPVPHILKNNTVAVENVREGKMDAARTTGEMTTPLVLHRQETEARGGSRSGVGGGILTV